jgi:2-isopropylmalate synthase
MALLAGADRLEGCLFGNGERTGNLDIVNVALNMYINGVSPGLDFSDIDGIRATVEYCNQLPVHPRHPYVGELVYTSFSGSHQDAIKKAFAARKDGDIWDMPYLPIDPKDLGRSYEAVIRVNSQSGKGGISYLLEAEYGLQLPRRLQIEFSQVVQHEMDTLGTEFTAADLWRIFRKEFSMDISQVPQYRMAEENGVVTMNAKLNWDGQERVLEGQGNGAIDAFVQALSQSLGRSVRVMNYAEHAVGEGANAQAVAYVEVRVDDGQTMFGVGMDANIVSASIRAIMSGLRRAAALQTVAA